MHSPRIQARTGSILLIAILVTSLGLTSGIANASPLGTSYLATVTNLPGSASGTLAFDGLASPFGGSGLRVREKSTSFNAYELIEFSLETADGDGFVGQQDDPMAPASVAVSGLEWSGDAGAARAEANSGFLWLSIDGEAQALSDPVGVGLHFGTHPLDPSIPIVFIDNASTTQLGFDTFGETAFEAFTALVGPILAAQIDGLHLGVAAAPVPEPGVGILVAAGAGGVFAMAYRRAGSRARDREMWGRDED